MNYIGSKEHVLEVVNEATKRFGDRLVPNPTRYKTMDSLCDLLDNFVSYFEADYFETHVDPETAELAISVSCDELVFKGVGAAFFFTFVRLFDSVTFSKDSEEDKVVVSMKICDMWECAR